jgi:hypothetical protein
MRRIARTGCEYKNCDKDRPKILDKKLKDACAKVLGKKLKLEKK